MVRSFVAKKVRQSTDLLLGTREPVAVGKNIGAVNPMLATANALIDSRGEFRALAEEILHCLPKTGDYGPNEYDIDSFVHSESFSGLFEKFNQLMDSIEVPNSNIEMPAPPGFAELYGRFADGSTVVDLGSGDEEKVARLKSSFPELTFETTDSKTGQPAIQVVHERSDAVFSSRNLLTQVPSDTLEAIQEVDGIHLCPDVPVLDSMGVYTHREGGKYCTADFEDYDHRLRGVKIVEGYLGYNTFKKRKIHLKTFGDVRAGPYIFDTLTYPDMSGRSLGDPDIGNKVDGVMMCIQFRNGKGMISDRTGSYQMLEGDCPDMRLMVELWCKWMFLIRVDRFRSYIPFHSGDLLRLFASRVKLKIESDGQIFRLIGPTEYGDFRVPGTSVIFPTDGVIIRSGPVDYYRKTKWTVDFTKSQCDLFVQMMEKFGYDVDVVGHGNVGVCEFFVDCPSSGIVVLVHNRCRDDKLVGNDPKEFIRMIKNARF